MNIVQQIVDNEAKLSSIRGRAEDAAEKVRTKARESEVAMLSLCLTAVASLEHGKHTRSRLMEAEIQESRAGKLAATAQDIVREFGESLTAEGYLEALTAEDCTTQASVFKRYKKVDPAMVAAVAQFKAGKLFQALTEPQKAQYDRHLAELTVEQELKAESMAKLDARKQQIREDAKAQIRAAEAELKAA